MNKLLYKEIRLVTHPTSIIFLGLSAMMLIPNYPYYVTFFYTTLGIFFTCLSGRENHDIFYTMTLPICKKDIVKARFIYAIFIEMFQVLTAIPFALIRRTYSLPGNEVGIEANIAFFGFSLIMLGIFNFVFFTKYYKNPDKVGISFGLGSAALWIYIIIAEILIHAIPFMRNYIDTKDPEYLSIKIIILLVGILAYFILTFIAYKKSIKSFNHLDL